MRQHRNPDDTLKWVRRGSMLAMLVIGWCFILAMNHFHITPPVVFVCLGYFAAASAIYTLYRTGATAVAVIDDTDDLASWGRPIGELSELEREKRSLLKAIKEAEFDHQMGKLSKADADSMIAVYRTRAIEVIKELDIQNSTSGKVGGIREQILREARARIHVEEKSAEPVKANKKAKGKDKQKARADKLADAVSAAKTELEADAAEKVEGKAEKVEAQSESPADGPRADDSSKSADKSDASSSSDKADAKSGSDKAGAKAGSDKSDAKSDAAADKADAKSSSDIEAANSDKDDAKSDIQAAKSDKSDKSDNSDNSETSKAESPDTASSKEAAR
jgi:hypothetical protein